MKARKARIILIIILVISMLMLNSCTALYKGLGRLGQFMGILYSKTTGGDDTTKTTNKLEELLEAIENQDSSAIMSLFSESSKEHIGIIHESELKKIKVFDVLPAHLSTICHVVILLRGGYSFWGREEAA